MREQDRSTEVGPTFFPAGGYHYLPSVFQYSAGVIAAPGFDIVRMRFENPLPLAQGFDRVRGVLARERRPLAAFCACELRSPAPFDEAGFRAFNRLYVETLKDWGLSDGMVNPVARTNVCPVFDPPTEPSFHAFCFTVERKADRQGFVVAGSGETVEGKPNYRDHIVRLGDVSPEALREKALFVLAEMERRLTRLGVGWTETAALNAYSVHDLQRFLAVEIPRRGAMPANLVWHRARPPVVDLEFEMDCRGIADERVV